MFAAVPNGHGSLPPPDCTPLLSRPLFKSSVSFACLCSRDVTNQTNVDKGAHFPTVSSQSIHGVALGKMGTLAGISVLGSYTEIVVCVAQ